MARRQLPPAPELTTATIHPPDEETTDAATLVAYLGSLLLLMSLAIYGQWVISGVLEEKNSRVVELILSAVRPRELLAGKVIGIGLLGFGQLVLVVGLCEEKDEGRPLKAGLRHLLPRYLKEDWRLVVRVCRGPVRPPTAAAQRRKELSNGGQSLV